MEKQKNMRSIIYGKAISNEEENIIADAHKKPPRSESEIAEIQVKVNKRKAEYALCDLQMYFDKCRVDVNDVLLQPTGQDVEVILKSPAATAAIRRLIERVEFRKSDDSHRIEGTVVAPKQHPFEDWAREDFDWLKSARFEVRDQSTPVPI